MAEVEKWTVKELRDRLDAYGDHVPVALVIERGPRSEVIYDFDISDGSSEPAHDGVMHVELRRWDA